MLQDELRPPRSLTTDTLDPADWGEFKQLARSVVDDAMAYLETVRERAVWQPVPTSLKERLQEPVPRSGGGARQAYEEFREVVFPHPFGNIHPRFWAWVNGTGTPFTVLADLLAATINPNVYGTDSIPYYIERQVLEWLKEIMRFPSSASGVLVSGGSMANYTGLAAALYAKAPGDIGEHGLRALPAQMKAYASNEAHNSVGKALRLLGLGVQALESVSADDAFRMNMPALEEAIAADRKAGRLPFCVIATAGTVNTGSFDPIDELADFCSKEGLWLHVDGAFGAFTIASKRLDHLTRGLERADSVAFDLHKWMYMPIDVGCVLVRHADAHRRAFAARADYLARTEGGLSDIAEPLGDYSLELTRSFRALKVWLGVKEQGLDAYVRAIEQDVALARYLGHRIDEHPDLELLAPVAANVVCFRLMREGWSEGELNDLNGSLLVALQESGVAAPSLTTVRGATALRVAITNHRTVTADLDLLLESIERWSRDDKTGRDKQASS